MAFSNVATVGFVFRNGDKVCNGDVGRTPVLVGQAVNAVKAGAELNNGVGRTAQVVIDTCDNVAKADKLFNGLGKVVKFASNNVNTLICASSGLKVFLAKDEDKQRTLITEGGTLGGMFLAEGWMKKNLNGILTKLSISGKWAPIVKGLIFIAGSIGASTVGNIVGEKTADIIEIPLGKEQREAYYLKKAQKEMKNTKNTMTYQPLDYKA